MEERRKRAIKKSLLGCTLVSMLAMPLMGCGISDSKFSYVTKEDGSIEVQGNISYNWLKKHEFMQVNYDDGTKNSYITEVIGNFSTHYYDIQTGKMILDISVNGKHSNDDSINSCYFISIENILIKHSFIKEEYSVDDIDKLYDMCIEEMEKEQDKEYIKKLEFNN